MTLKGLKTVDNLHNFFLKLCGVPNLFFYLTIFIFTIYKHLYSLSKFFEAKMLIEIDFTLTKRVGGFLKTSSSVHAKKCSKFRSKVTQTYDE